MSFLFSQSLLNLVPTGLTAGSVVFVGSTGLLAQDNANFFWNDTDNRLGLGTSSPGTLLDINGVTTHRGSILLSANNVFDLGDATNKFRQIYAASACFFSEIYGTTTAGGTLLLGSTSHATRGLIYFGALGSSAYDEANIRLGLNTNAPGVTLDVRGAARIDGQLDLSAIAAGSPNLKITATSDTPATAWNVVGTNNASNAPAGYLEILVGASARYIPFWT